MKELEIIDNANYNEKIKDELVLVDFYSKTCGPCKVMMGILEEISEELNQIKFYKIDAHENMDLSVELGIMSVPTILIYKNGEIIERLVGLKPKEELLKV